MEKVSIQRLLSMSIQRLEKVAQYSPENVYSCNTGEKFEKLVNGILCECINELGMDSSKIIDYSEGSHRFPDIIVTLYGSKYGVEVKSSSSQHRSWKINGNSILGSTKDKEVLEIYVIYGKTAKNNMAFKARRYEDCIENIVVTHSPRYLINMDLPSGESFFEQSGISYKEISNCKHPIELITSYFKSKGEKAWWLSESTPAAFKYYTKLDRSEQIDIRAYAFVHYPEILGSSPVKYKNFAIWLVTEKSVVMPSLRDIFTGGGRKDISCSTQTYANMPRILTSLRECIPQFLNCMVDADSEVLAEEWGYKQKIGSSINEKLLAWIEVGGCYLQPSIGIYNANEFLKNLFGI